MLRAYKAAVDLQVSLPPQRGRVEPLTEGEVAADRRGRMPPQAMMMLSTIWEMRWIVLWTKMMFSLLFTKSITDLVEWLKWKWSGVKIEKKTAFNI